MALYIPHSIFHLARLLNVRPETFGPYYVCGECLGKQLGEEIHNLCVYTFFLEYSQQGR